MNASPGFRHPPLALRLGLASLALLISAALLGGLMGLFHRNALAAVAAHATPGTVQVAMSAGVDSGVCTVASSR